MNNAAGIRIRRADASELPVIGKAMGQGHFFADRLRRQEEGHGLLLVAWFGDSPVGDVYVWLAPPEGPEIRERLPGVPLLNHLEVHPEYRGRGIGTEIMSEAEEVVAARGYERLALGVDPHNEDAMRLYKRLGYVAWPYPEIKTLGEEFREDGTCRRIPETCHVLVKYLRCAPDHLRPW